MRPTQEKLWLWWHVPVRCHTVKVHRHWAQQSAQVAAINPTAFSRCQEPGCQEASLVPLYFSQIKRLFRRHILKRSIWVSLTFIYFYLCVCMSACIYVIHAWEPTQAKDSDSLGHQIPLGLELQVIMSFPTQTLRTELQVSEITSVFNHQGHLCSSGYT